MAESISLMAKSLNNPIQVNLPALPIPPPPPSPVGTFSPAGEMDDIGVWGMNMRRNLLRLSPRKRTKKMDDYEDDLKKFLRNIEREQ